MLAGVGIGFTTLQLWFVGLGAGLEQIINKTETGLGGYGKVLMKRLKGHGSKGPPGNTDNSREDIHTAWEL